MPAVKLNQNDVWTFASATAWLHAAKVNQNGVWTVSVRLHDYIKGSVLKTSGELSALPQVT